MSEHIKLECVWDRIDKAIERSGLSKSEIARRGGFERRTLNGRAGNIMPSLGTLARFCAVTHTSADYILGLKDSHE